MSEKYDRLPGFFFFWICKGYCIKRIFINDVYKAKQRDMKTQEIAALEEEPNRFTKSRDHNEPSLYTVEPNPKKEPTKGFLKLGLTFWNSQKLFYFSPLPN